MAAAFFLAVSSIAPAAAQQDPDSSDARSPQLVVDHLGHPALAPPAEDLHDLLRAARAEEPVVAERQAGLVVGGGPEQSSGLRLCFSRRVPDVVRRSAVEAATQWSDALDLTGPELEIDIYWLPFQSPASLGAAGPTTFVADARLPTNHDYPVALASHLLDQELTERLPCDLRRDGDILVLLNSAAGGANPLWHLGEGDPPAGAVDLTTVLLHELAHGFGMVTSAQIADPDGDEQVLGLRWPGVDQDGGQMPGNIYDALVTRCDVEQPIGCRSTRSVAFGDTSVLTSGAAWLDMGGTSSTELFTPLRWNNGSSLVHFDEERHGGTDPLMTPFVEPGQAVRTLDARTLDVMERMGWRLQDQTRPAINVPEDLGPALAPFESLDQLRKFMSEIDPSERVTFEALVSSLDAQGLAATVHQSLTNPDDQPRRQLTRLYLGVLGRAPDIGGEQFWLERLGDGMSMEDVAERFTASDEYRAAARNPEGTFVEDVYERVFGRLPDEDGRAFWINELEQGLHPGRFTLVLTEAPEHRELVVRQVDAHQLTVALLDRSATADEASLDGLDLAAQLLASEAFRLRLG